MDLRPPREAALHFVARHVTRHALAEFVHEVRAFRPGTDKTHFPQKYVQQLRKLVKIPAAEELSASRSAIVRGLRPHRPRLFFGVDFHGAEFDQAEDVPVAPHAFLKIKNGPLPFQLDQHRDDKTDRKKYKRHNSRHHKVEGPFEETIPRVVERERTESQKRDVADVFHADIAGDETVDIRAHLEINESVLASCHKVRDLFPGKTFIHENDLVGLEFFNESFPMIRKAEDRNVLHVLANVFHVRGKDTDRSLPVMGILLGPFDQGAGVAIQPDDQDFDHIFFLLAAPISPLDERVAADADKDAGEEPDKDQVKTRVGELPVEKSKSHEQDHSVGHHLDHEKDLFDPAHVTRSLIKAGLAEKPEIDRDDAEERVPVVGDRRNAQLRGQPSHKAEKIRHDEAQDDHDGID